ncbi:MAG: hypothetical protein CM15mP127_04230 [Gammaproteobacteria bacterium]|nr:MAG: hypothetical protein CM15mP127_04230 [Gammaproteobacteria bacterium]
MNKFSIWTNLTILMVLLIGILYSLPNLYPAKPSIQATYANSALAADQNLYDRIENVLDSLK